MPDENPQSQDERPAWAVAFERRLTERNGDSNRLAEELYRDNYAQREELRQLRGRIPADGAVILTPEQAAQYQAYQQLGAPDALTQQQTAYAELQQRTQRLEREQGLRRAAEVAGYRPNVLSRLPELPAVEITEAQGDTPAVAFVLPAEGQRVPLADYVTQHYADFLPALAVDAPSPQQQRTPYPAQGQGGAKPTSAVDTYLSKTYKHVGKE